MLVEISLVNFCLFLFASIGMTKILVYGKIFDDVRSFLKWILPPKVYSVLECYQCTGFWTGLFCGYALLTHNPAGILMCGFAGSYASEFAQHLSEYLEANSMITVLPNEGG